MAVRGTGIGLRAIHHDEVIARGSAVGWLEAHSENHFGPGSRTLLRKARSNYPVSLHGVGLSLGSTDPLDERHLSQVVQLAREIEPLLRLGALVVGLRRRPLHKRSASSALDTQEALARMIERVQRVQDALGREMLIENVPSYLRFTDSTIPEWEFLASLTRASGCKLLLDVNNVYVNAMNHGFDAQEFLSAIPTDAVREIHLAGHSIHRVGAREIRIDTHDAPVCDAVWALYSAVLERFGPIPTLVEWDSNIPPLDDLVAEAHKADRLQERHHVRAA